MKFLPDACRVPLIRYQINDIEKTEEAIENGQVRDTGNIGFIIQNEDKQNRLENQMN
jgi:hypothetical protein